MKKNTCLWRISLKKATNPESKSKIHCSASTQHWDSNTVTQSPNQQLWPFGRLSSVILLMELKSSLTITWLQDKVSGKLSPAWFSTYHMVWTDKDPNTVLAELKGICSSWTMDGPLWPKSPFFPKTTDHWGNRTSTSSAVQMRETCFTHTDAKSEEISESRWSTLSIKNCWS